MELGLDTLINRLKQFFSVDTLYTIDLPSQQLFELSNQSRRVRTLRILNLGWLAMGLVALVSLPFNAPERLLLVTIVLITGTSYFLILFLVRRGEAQLAALLFSILVALAFLVFFLLTASQLGIMEALETQVNLLMMMGLAVVFGGALVGKRTALALAFINSLCLATIVILLAPTADPRFSLHVFWWLLALTIWLYEVNLEGALAHLQLSNERLEDRVDARTSDLQQTVVALEQSQHNLEVANAELRVLSQMKDEFVANVSHELRTPLASLSLTEELLRRNPAKTQIYLDRLKRETERLEQIIEDLLRLSRLDQDRAALMQHPTDLNELTWDYVNDRIPLAERKGLSLVHKAMPDLPQVVIDGGLLGQVVGILLTNALNYTPKGGTITVSTSTIRFEHKHWIGFSVGDTGHGISEDEQAKLFTRFFRGTASETSGAAGTGLGLAIAWEIVELHQGHIKVESEGIVNKGATFSVWLPANIESIKQLG